MSGDDRDLVIEQLADENAQLVELIADLAWENHWLRVIADRAFTKPYQRRQERTLEATEGRAA